jgi:ABC-type uncharacterized transport system fused permease/ATPase subunit
MLNVERDLSERRLVAALTEDITENAYPVRSFAEASNPGFQYFDFVPIEVRDISVRLPASEAALLSLKGHFKCNQGELVTIIGPHHGGKTLFLKVLGGVILPEIPSLMDINSHQARLLIPSHLRVLHISPDPMFLLGSIEDNLTYGTSKQPQLVANGRVIAILTQLGISPKLLEHEEVDMHWSQVLSQSQQRLLSIARALIANPDVLVMHQPLRHLDEAACTRVMKVLKEFVADRGVALQSRERPFRRPKTCIMTSGDAMSMCYADRVYLSSQETGISLLTAEQVKSLIENPFLAAKAGTKGVPKHLLA